MAMSTESFELQDAPYGAIFLLEELDQLQYEADIVKRTQEVNDAGFEELSKLAKPVLLFDQIEPVTEERQEAIECMKIIGAAALYAKRELRGLSDEFYAAADYFSARMAAKYRGIGLVYVGGRAIDLTHEVLVGRGPAINQPQEDVPVIYGEPSRLAEYVNGVRPSLPPKEQSQPVKVRLANLEEWRNLLTGLA